MDAIRTAPVTGPRRNKGFDETHRELIETAVRMISQTGVEALSIAALAREMGINRTTVYYHFDSREALLAAVKAWATERLAEGMDASASQLDRTAGISRFVLGNPELIKLWIDDFISAGDIRDSYSRWDELVQGTEATLKREFPDEDIDAEVWCVMLLCSSIVGARVYSQRVRPERALEQTVSLFLKEHLRTLRRDRVLR
jgi:AcrR family transcriptional regulator